jgi:beta-aspartyl-dipeptidase (metallo-type)
MKYLDSGAPAGRVTISSDGGGCLPVFNEQGEITAMDIGHASSLPLTLKNLLGRGAALEQVLPAFTANVADILRLPDRGRIRVGHAADLIVLDDDADVHDVMIGGIWHVRDGRQRISGQFEDPNGE